MRIALVNMPFADWHRPSVALSQLAAHIREQFGDAVSVDVHYVNIDFALLFGPGEYTEFANNVGHGTTGVGEWLFRQIAFPDAPDNAADYFKRYFADDASAGFRAQLLDVRERLAAFCDKTISEYALDQADVVGFTSMFAQNLPSIAIARLIKDRNRDVITVMGGCNCEAPMGGVIAEHIDALDYVFSGPGLQTFPEFVRCLLDDRRDDADAIVGVLTRRNVRTPKFRRGVGRERQLDDYVNPDYQSFVTAFTDKQVALRESAGHVEPILYFETSRGCWWGERSHCTFCGLNGLDMGYRSMTPDRAVEQLRWLFSYYPWCRTFHGTDNILPRNYVRDVFSKIKAPGDAMMFYEIKVPVSDNDMRALSEAGVREVQPGIEALATSTLKLMAKGTTSFLNLQFLQKCLRYDINPLWNLLLGFPGEPASVYEKYYADLPALVHLPPPEGTFLVRFDRYSPYFTKSLEYGLDLQPMDFYELVYADVPRSALRDLAYYFVDRKLNDYQVQSVRWLGPLRERTNRWRELWQSGNRPVLRLERADDGGWGVLDTRYDERTWTPVDSDELAVLRRLSSPVLLSKLPGELSLDEHTAAEIVLRLQQRRWLFNEDDAVFSLVMSEAAELTLV